MKFTLTKLILVLILASIIIISGCNGALSAKDGDTVKVHYTLRLADGTEHDSSIGGDPLEFEIGTGAVIPGFNDAVIGMKPGESKTVDIPADKAYGEYRDDLVEVVNRDSVMSNSELEVGSQLFSYNQYGQKITYTVIALTDSTVTLDRNHPLAGEDLTFDIELVEIL